ncbi:copper amine oxidase N-terminal domain-containing protein [Paenibacillus sp. BIC5C1]|uniref:copper amine oxidase N-terminal domain-containing protein n=1 Tax=Paenibacillus sp. BIC5C1 TaxID=3078263 RepID=UPI0028E54220|nr:copper amine oxidase N-terminal domain-containing protein [Paenibacillus sp. BIC5C1]
MKLTFRKVIISIMILIFMMLNLSANTNMARAESADSIPVHVLLHVGSNNVIVNGQNQKLDERGSTPIIKNGSTYLPVASVMKLFGGKSGWNSVSKEITLQYKDSTAVLKPDNLKAKVNGKSVSLSVAPTVINGTTVVPLRFLEQFKIAITWHGASSFISLTEKTEGYTPWYAGQHTGKQNIKEGIYYDGGKQYYSYKTTFLNSWGTPVVIPFGREVISGANEIEGKVDVDYYTIFYYTDNASIIGTVWENYDGIKGEDFLEILGMTYSGTLSSIKKVSVKGAESAYVVEERFYDSGVSSDSTTLMAFVGNKVYSINFTQDIYDAYQKLDDEAYYYFLEKMIPNMSLGQNAGAAG